MRHPQHPLLTTNRAKNDEFALVGVYIFRFVDTVFFRAVYRFIWLRRTQILIVGMFKASN